MKQNPVVHMRSSELRNLRDKHRNEGILFVTIIFLTVMRDKFGYGRKRLNRIYKAMEELSQAIAKGYVRLTDLELVLQEESKITVGMKGD